MSIYRTASILPRDYNLSKKSVHYEGDNLPVEAKWKYLNTTLLERNNTPWTKAREDNEVDP